jgi:hypothetical protein
MEKFLKLAEKYSSIENEFIDPLSTEEILAVIKDEGFVDLKESGEVIINLESYVTKINEDLIVFEDDLFLQHLDFSVRLSDDGVAIRLNEIDKELLLNEGRKRKMSVKKTKLLQLEKESLLDARSIVVRTVGLVDMAIKLGIVTEEGLDIFSIKLNQLIVTEAHSASLLLAQERGSYRAWNDYSISDSHVLSTLFNLEANELMTMGVLEMAVETGLRNNIHFLIQ